MIKPNRVFKKMRHKKRVTEDKTFKNENLKRRMFKKKTKKLKKQTNCKVKWTNKFFFCFATVPQTCL